MKYFCHTECYHNDRLFEPGQVLDAQPGEYVPKWFQTEPYTHLDKPITSDAREVRVDQLATLHEMTHVGEVNRLNELTGNVGNKKASLPKSRAK